MRVLFHVKIVGEGETVGDAWEDAIQSFALDPGSPDELPDEVQILKDNELGSES